MSTFSDSLKSVLHGAVLGVLALGFAGAAAAWTAAPSTPPNSNVAAPINTSATAQAKAGQLTVGSFRVSGLSGTGDRCVQVSVSGTFSAASGPCGTGSGSGDITSVGAGSGLNGGGSTGAVSLSVDSSVVRTSGDQNISGTKKFTSYLCIDSKCRSNWNPTGSAWTTSFGRVRDHNCGTDAYVYRVQTRDSGAQTRVSCKHFQ